MKCNSCGERFTDEEVENDEPFYVTVYNSSKTDDEDLLTDVDVDFEVDFDGDEYKMVDICSDCEDKLDWSKL